MALPWLLGLGEWFVASRGIMGVGVGGAGEAGEEDGAEEGLMEMHAATVNKSELSILCICRVSLFCRVS